MIELLQQLDREVFLILHQLHRSLFVDDVMWLLSSRWVWVPMYAVLVWWLFRQLGWRRAALWVAMTVLAVTFADQICASVIRPLVGRLRPSNPANPLAVMVTVVRDYRGGPNGFPSCHAANTFALAVMMALLFRDRALTWWLFSWAILNCFSRIYLGVHYPGDILVGAFVGALGSVLFYCAGKWLQKQYLSDGDGSPVVRAKYNPVVLTGLITIAVILVISLF